MPSCSRKATTPVPRPRSPSACRRSRRVSRVIQGSSQPTVVELLLRQFIVGNLHVRPQRVAAATLLLSLHISLERRWIRIFLNEVVDALARFDPGADARDEILHEVAVQLEI